MPEKPFSNIDELKYFAKNIRSHKSLRQFARRVIASFDIQSYDLHHKNRNRIKTNEEGPFYNWDATISLTKQQYTDITSALKKYAKNQNLTSKDVYDIVTIIHEELHGCSPLHQMATLKLDGFNYKHHASIIYLEELSTELLARHIVTQLNINHKEAKIPTYNKKWTHNKHEYTQYACLFADWLCDTYNFDKKTVINNVLNAAINLRKSPRKFYNSTDYTRYFATCLKLNKTQIEQFVTYMEEKA